MPDMLGDWSRGMDRDLPYEPPKPPYGSLEQKMSRETEPGAYVRPHVTDREAAVAAEAIRNRLNKPKKGKKGKKQKKNKPSDFKPAIMTGFAADLRPGDVVLRRTRKGEIKPHDRLYTVKEVQHYNGAAATDGYMHSPDRVEVVAVDCADGSIGTRSWYGAQYELTLTYLRPFKPAE